MFTHYRTQGLILKKVDKGETDRIFNFYTKDFGRVELLARAERKITSKLRAGLELFYLSEIAFIQGKIGKTLTDTVLINNFPNLRRNLKKLRIAYRVAELSEKFIKAEEKDEKIWQLLNETFEQLNKKYKTEAMGQKVYYCFFWNLFSILGYCPELYHCSLCQKKLGPEKIFFSAKEGGLLCNQCKLSADAVNKIEANVVKLIRILIEKNWQFLEKLKIEKKDLKGLKEISNCYLSEILEQSE